MTDNIHKCSREEEEDEEVVEEVEEVGSACFATSKIIHVIYSLNQQMYCGSYTTELYQISPAIAF